MREVQTEGCGGLKGEALLFYFFISHLCVKCTLLLGRHWETWASRSTSITGAVFAVCLELFPVLYSHYFITCSQHIDKGGITDIPICQMRKLRPRDAKELACSA